eukprot:COSAG02_NODE_5571_length_4222_cov_8.387339_1_plen_466_part_00
MAQTIAVPQSDEHAGQHRSLADCSGTAGPVAPYAGYPEHRLHRFCAHVAPPEPAAFPAAVGAMAAGTDSAAAMCCHDVVVVGGGAWGLAVLKLLRDDGLDVVGVERGELCQNLRMYMRRMTMHYPTPYMAVEEDDELLAKGSDHHPAVEDMTDHYLRFAERHALPVHTHTELTRLDGEKGDFTLELRSARSGAVERVGARRVVLATGRYDTPILTGAPGELREDVEHYLKEWEHLRGQRLLFIGGGFSSADGVSRLCEANTCCWVTRKSRAQIDSMLVDQRTKWGMFDQPTTTIYDGKSVAFFCNSEVSSLTDGIATIIPSDNAADPIRDHSDNFQVPASVDAGTDGQGGDDEGAVPAVRQWAFDRCFMLTGHGPSESLVEQVLHGDVTHDDETWEATSRPGVFVIGALSPHHYHLGHIGLLQSPVYNAPELTVAGGSRIDQTRISLRVRDAIVADLRDGSAQSR